MVFKTTNSYKYHYTTLTDKLQENDDKFILKIFIRKKKRIPLYKKIRFVSLVFCIYSAVLFFIRFFYAFLV